MLVVGGVKDGQHLAAHLRGAKDAFGWLGKLGDDELIAIAQDLL